MNIKAFVWTIIVWLVIASLIASVFIFGEKALLVYVIIILAIILFFLVWATYDWFNNLDPSDPFPDPIKPSYPKPHPSPSCNIVNADRPKTKPPVPRPSK